VDGPHVIDVMPSFWAFWSTTDGLAPSDRVRLLRERVIAPHQAFYDQVVGVPDDARLARYLETLAPAIPALRKISASFPCQVADAFASFTRAFPDFDRSTPIYVIPSLFTSSGQVRDFEGRWIVTFGLDVLAVLLPDFEDRRPDAFHELFHAWHYQVNPEIAAAAKEAFSRERTSPLSHDLWIEGVALHAVRRLAPAAPLHEVLASRALPAEGPPAVPRVAGELLARLDAIELDIVADYFFMSTTRRDFPPRMAYLVGLRMTECLAAEMTLDEMARLHGSDLRRAVARGLTLLATSACPPPAGRDDP
jgi:hypothetical protein